MQTIQQIPAWFSKQGLVAKMAIGCSSLIMLCCLCSIPIAILSPSTLTPKVKNTSVANVAPSPIAAQTEKPVGVETIAPIDTPEPTDTPLAPTATQNANLIEPGTYLVGTDIQPGIYRGEAGDDTFSTCYWARLKDLSGGLDAVLANENAKGQFYVEIKDNDKAFETHCELAMLSSLPPTSGEFPTKIAIGIYIIGRDIQAGTYKGKAGSDITESCYWARLKNVAGGLDAVIANDIATGQYYVQVGKTDFALSTGCELERVGD